MIVVTKNNTTEEQVAEVVHKIEKLGLIPHVVRGQNQFTISVLGKTEKFQTSEFSMFPFVENILRISKPFKLAYKLTNPEGTKIKVKNLEIGLNNKLCQIMKPK